MIASTRAKPLIYIRDLLFELVLRDLKLRYKRSVLGLAWSLLNPLLQLLVFSLVFTFIVPIRVPRYTIFLFIGILVWTWFSSSLYAATTCIVDNPAMIRHPGFPVSILPVITVASNLINFLLAAPILIAFLITGGYRFTAALALLPLVIAIQFLLTVSLAYLLAAFHVPFRDTQYLLGISLTLGFYLVPIFYSSSAIPASWQDVYHLNPMVSILESYRTIIMDGRAPAVEPLILVGVCSIALLTASYWLFVRARHHFVEQL